MLEASSTSLEKDEDRVGVSEERRKEGRRKKERDGCGAGERFF